MKKRLVLVGMGIVMGVTVMLSACEPAIPHPIAGRSNCISCHGQDGVKPYPAFHVKDGFGNDACTSCHKLAPDINK